MNEGRVSYARADVRIETETFSDGDLEALDEPRTAAGQDAVHVIGNDRAAASSF